MKTYIHKLLELNTELSNLNDFEVDERFGRDYIGIVNEIQLKLNSFDFHVNNYSIPPERFEKNYSNTGNCLYINRHYLIDKINKLTSYLENNQ